MYHPSKYQIHKDKREGYGVFTWTSGNTYKGMWKDGNHNGEGTKYISKTGETQTGIWKDDYLVQKK